MADPLAGPPGDGDDGSKAGPAATPGGVPNPAGPEGRGTPAPAPFRASRPAQLAERLPDWMGSIRFRLTALYSIFLFLLAAFTVAGMYGVLSRRLHEEKVYVTRIDVVERLPDGSLQVTPRAVTDEYRLVEHLANERALGLLRTYSVSSLVALFFASLITGWLVAGRVLAPIGRITGVAREIQATDLSRRIALRGPPDELKELADTFDAMLARLDDDFESQQRFIQEASHELRNPLAVIRTNLDVALSDPDPDPAEIRRVAELVQATASRMSRLVDDLLVYARRGAPAHEVGPVDLGRLVADVADELAASASARSLAVDLDLPSLGDGTTDGPGGAVVAVGDRIGLRQAVANLVLNAVRLAPAGSTLHLGVGRADGGSWITVGDEGPGIPAEQRELVFERFWRGDRNEARAAGRSGLGLAIVRQIMDDHRGSASVGPSPAGGSIFTLWLPDGPPATPEPD